MKSACFDLALLPPLSSPCPGVPWSPPLQAGLDSLGSVELRNALASQFGLELPATAVFDHPSVAALAAFIAQQLQARERGAAADGSGWDSSSGSDGELDLSPSSGMLGLHCSGVAAHPWDLTTDLLGVGCLYPGAAPAAAATAVSGLGSFWAAAAAGASLQRPVPHQRWDVDWCYSSEAVPGRSYARFAAWAEVGGWASAGWVCRGKAMPARCLRPGRTLPPTPHTRCLDLQTTRRVWICLTLPASVSAAPRRLRWTRRPAYCCRSPRRRLPTQVKRGRAGGAGAAVAWRSCAVPGAVSLAPK